MTFKTPQITKLDLDSLLRTEIENQTDENDELWSLPNRDPREDAHSIFQYPAMMVPEVQRRIIRIILKIRPDVRHLLDPYVGAGTSITAGMRCGLQCNGQDINPLAVLVSKAKTYFGWDDNDLRVAYEQVIAEASNSANGTIEINFANIDKWFQNDVAIELSRLRKAISRINNLGIRRALWVTLAETIRLTSNDRTSTFKLHARPKEELINWHPSPIQIFNSLSIETIHDLILFKNQLLQSNLIKENIYLRSVNIFLKDSKEEIEQADRQQRGYDLVVTSPPYGDNATTVTYGQHAYLPLQWINLEDISSEAESSFLKTTQEIDRRSLGGQYIPKKEFDDVRSQLSISSKSLSFVFEKLYEKPYDLSAKVAGFYVDFVESLDKIIASLADEAYLIWTIGNRNVGGIQVPNDQILIEFLANHHIELISAINRTIHNKRMPQKNSTSPLMGNEKILVFRKRGENE